MGELDGKCGKELTLNSEQWKHFEKLVVHIKLNPVMRVREQDNPVERSDIVANVSGFKLRESI